MGFNHVKERTVFIESAGAGAMLLVEAVSAGASPFLDVSRGSIFLHEATINMAINEYNPRLIYLFMTFIL